MINSIISRMDYCNLASYNLPKLQLRKLQMVLSSAVIIRVISPQEKITPVFIELHWLPVRARIVFKLCVLARRSLISRCPPYLRELLHVTQSGEVIYICRAFLEPHFMKHSTPHTFDCLLSTLPPQACRISSFLISKEPRISRFKKKLIAFMFSACCDMETSTITMAYEV